MATGRVIYLVRHAIAAERGDAWPDDSKRPLTKRGMERFREAVRGLAELEPSLGEIFTSPLVRAEQTAELLSEELPGKPPVTVLDALAPGHAPSSVVAHLARSARKRRIAVVGHEPDLGQLAAHLVGARRALAFKKGGICRIDLASLPSRRTGTLVWFAPPRLLRDLGRSKSKRRK